MAETSGGPRSLHTLVRSTRIHRQSIAKLVSTDFTARLLPGRAYRLVRALLRRWFHPYAGRNKYTPAEEEELWKQVRNANYYHSAKSSPIHLTHTYSLHLIYPNQWVKIATLAERDPENARQHFMYYILPRKRSGADGESLECLDIFRLALTYVPFSWKTLVAGRRRRAHQTGPRRIIGSRTSARRAPSPHLLVEPRSRGTDGLEIAY